MMNNKPEIKVSTEKNIMKKIKQRNKQARHRFEQKVGKDKIKKTLWR